jgi:hypothetical protein
VRLVLVVASAAFASALVGGCFIFTGGTDGYQLVDSGQAETSTTCSGDAECVALTCVSASDCDAGAVCCLTAGASSLASSCQAAPCPELQLCAAASECTGAGASCTTQQCASNGVSLTLQSCSLIPGCTN